MTRLCCRLAVLLLGVTSATTAHCGPAQLLAPFKAELLAALQAGLAEGAEHALDVCRLQAPAIAARHSTHGVRVGRTSHRLRNPQNAGPAWADAVLAQYLEAPERAAPRELDLGGGRKGWVEPITTAPLCLTCHGEHIPAELDALIRQRYPVDAAVGFRAGELRGVFWLSYPAGQ